MLPCTLWGGGVHASEGVWFDSGGKYVAVQCGCCCEGAIVRVHVVLCMMLQWDSVALYHAYNMQDQQVCPLPCNL